MVGWRKLIVTLAMAVLVVLCGFTMSAAALPVVVDGLVWLAIGYGGANAAGKAATSLATRKAGPPPIPKG